MASYVSVLGCQPAPVKVGEEQMIPKTFYKQIQGIVGVLGQLMMGEPREHWPSAAMGARDLQEGTGMLQGPESHSSSGLGRVP